MAKRLVPAAAEDMHLKKKPNTYICASSKWIKDLRKMEQHVVPCITKEPRGTGEHAWAFKMDEEKLRLPACFSEKALEMMGEIIKSIGVLCDGQTGCGMLDNIVLGSQQPYIFFVECPDDMAVVLGVMVRHMKTLALEEETVACAIMKAIKGEPIEGKKDTPRGVILLAYAILFMLCGPFVLTCSEESAKEYLDIVVMALRHMSTKKTDQDQEAECTSYMKSILTTAVRVCEFFLKRNDELELYAKANLDAAPFKGGIFVNEIKTSAQIKEMVRWIPLDLGVSFDEIKAFGAKLCITLYNKTACAIAKIVEEKKELCVRLFCAGDCKLMEYMVACMRHVAGVERIRIMRHNGKAYEGPPDAPSTESLIITSEPRCGLQFYLGSIKPQDGIYVGMAETSLKAAAMNRDIANGFNVAHEVLEKFGATVFAAFGNGLTVAAAKMDEDKTNMYVHVFGKDPVSMVKRLVACAHLFTGVDCIRLMNHVDLLQSAFPEMVDCGPIGFECTESSAPKLPTNKSPAGIESYLGVIPNSMCIPLSF